MTALPVNLKVMEGDAAEEARSVSAEVLEKNSDFRQFTERMKGMGRTFAIKSKKEASARLVAPPTDGDNGGAEGSSEWYDCCLREYLERKRLFANRFTSRKQLALRIVSLLLPFLAVLWAVWPLWRVLIDVETDSYYKTLGVSSTATPGEITKAYRSLMKRWHPDQNPTCGQYCRDQTERIKEAYDLLLSRGDHRFTLANQYHEGLMTLRSTLSFRGFQISGSAAMEVYMALTRLFPSMARESGSLRLWCGVLILLFCIVHETLYVTGFNLSTFIGLFYYAFSMAKASAQQRFTEEVMRNSYFDVLRDAAVLLSCAWAASLASVLRTRSTVSTEELFCMLYGSVYVLSFLYKFAPNVYDNFLMRKYSLPLTYVDMGGSRFTWMRFALSEGSFLVDDLFVFTCKVASPFRVVVYATHFVCLCQLFLLPWDAPITVGKSNAKSSGSRAAESGAASPAETDQRPAAAQDAEAAPSLDESTIRESALTKEEEGIVTDLDTEDITWIDIAGLKYRALITTLGRRHAQQSGQKADAVDIASSADLQNVNVFAVGRTADAGAGPAQPKISVLCQVRDPTMSCIIAQDRGPKMLMPLRPNTPWNIDVARAEYAKALGETAPFTNSQLWRRRRTPGGLLQVAQATLVLAAVCVAAAVACAVIGPTSYEIVRSSKGLDSSLRPQLFARFSTILSADHFTNAVSGGLLTIANMTVCVLDWWDAGVTVGYIR